MLCSGLCRSQYVRLRPEQRSVHVSYLMFAPSFVDHFNMERFHPLPDYLERYALGLLDSESDTSVSKHLARCRTCLEITDRLLCDIDVLRERSRVNSVTTARGERNGIYVPSAFRMSLVMFGVDELF